jgi:hypothetical protein
VYVRARVVTAAAITTTVREDTGISCRDNNNDFNNTNNHSTIITTIIA